jgi:DNA-binding transcriptional MocR family regulator
MGRWVRWSCNEESTRARIGFADVVRGQSRQASLFARRWQRKRVMMDAPGSKIIELLAAPAPGGGGGRYRYTNIASVIRGAVLSGLLLPGAKLPAERNLATRLGISRGTVVAAYESLRQEGLVVSRQGSGTWVASIERAPDEGLASTFTAGDSGTISFALANLPASALVRDAIGEVVASQDLQSALAGTGYAPFGLEVLRSRIAAYYSNLALPTSEEQILVTTGSQQAIFTAASQLVASGDIVVVEDPTYIGTIDAFKAAGASLQVVPIGADGVDVVRLADAVSAGGVRLICVTPVHNPTGVVQKESILRAVADVAMRCGAILIEDRTLANVTFAEDPPLSLATIMPENQVVVIESTSKFLWGGLRVGWIRAHRSLVQDLARRKSCSDLASPVLSQLVASQLMEGDRVSHARRVVRQRISERLRFLTMQLAHELPSWEWVAPAGGLSLWTRLPVGDAREFAHLALARGVATVPGPALSPTGGFRDYIRLPYVLRNADVAEGIGRLATAWKEYEPVAAGQKTFAVVV